MVDDRTEQAARLMDRFAEATGLSSERPPRRYLWTDAHAVCNFLALERRTGDARYRALALGLVDQVHEVLGHHRADAAEQGWLSGLPDTEARRHPTVAGLRIGKPLPERRPHERYDQAVEWERDGQYYHYLTKWMHALRQVAAASGEHRYLLWARELAVTAFQRFRATSGPLRLYWKMSIDLTRPLLPASGQHDPLDGLVTALTLAGDQRKWEGAERDALIIGLSRLCRTESLATDDPLGLGGLLFDAGRMRQLLSTVPEPGIDVSRLPAQLLDAALPGLDAYERSRPQRLPADARLAFRELGLCIGLRAIHLTGPEWPEAGLTVRARRLSTHMALGEALERFWLAPANRRGPTWTEHEDINAVMLATSLVPEGFVVLGGLAAVAGQGY